MFISEVILYTKQKLKSLQKCAVQNKQIDFDRNKFTLQIESTHIYMMLQILDINHSKNKKILGNSM